MTELHLFPHSGEMHATAPLFISLINHRRKSRVVEVFLIAGRESENKNKCFAREKATNSSDEAIVRAMLSPRLLSIGQQKSLEQQVRGSDSLKVKLSVSFIKSEN